MDQHRTFVVIAITIISTIHATTAARYVPKWKKQACEIPALQNEQSHYTCDDNGDVKCLPGVYRIRLYFFFTYE